MPLFYQHNINDTCKLAIWHITETEKFFLEKVPLQKHITHWHKRLQHLAGRYLLHQLFRDFPYDLIEIADTRKPFLPNEKYHFSISHCGEYAAAIVSKYSRVGIDIEIPTARVDKIKHKFLSSSELKFVEMNDLPEGQYSSSSTKVLTLLWSAKEAVFKWAGDGGVDFIDHIPLKPSLLKYPEGSLYGSFNKDRKFALDLNYRFFDQLVLVWIDTTNDFIQAQ